MAASEYTSIKCPKCGYRRKLSDTAPDWQCPSCGVAYAKVAGGGSAEPLAHGIARDIPNPNAAKNVEDADGGFFNRLIYALLAGVCGAGVGGIGWVLFGMGGAKGLLWLTEAWLWLTKGGPAPGSASHYSDVVLSSMPHDKNILHWVIPTSITFAVLGFITKGAVADDVADSAGSMVSPVKEAIEWRVREAEPPSFDGWGWIVLAILLFVAACVAFIVLKGPHRG